MEDNSVTFSLSRGFSFFGCCSYSPPVIPCTLFFFPLLPLTFAFWSKQYIALALQIIKSIDTAISYRTTIFFFCHTLGGRSFSAASPKLWLIAYRFHASIFFFRKNRWDLFNLIMNTSQLLQLWDKNSGSYGIRPLKPQRYLCKPTTAKIFFTFDYFSAIQRYDFHILIA